jgi:hypothetical protein
MLSALLLSHKVFIRTNKRDMKKRKRCEYYAISELGELRFKSYKEINDWILIYAPKWLHKIRVFKSDPPREGEYEQRKSGRWFIKF